MVINEKQLSELEAFFAKKKLPKEVQLDAGAKITDVSRFVESHLTVLRNNLDMTIYEVFYQRLIQLKEKIN